MHWYAPTALFIKYLTVDEGVKKKSRRKYHGSCHQESHEESRRLESDLGLGLDVNTVCTQQADHFLSADTNAVFFTGKLGHDNYNKSA